MKRALVINTARMGDLIQSTPLMQGLRDNGYEVTLLYSDAFKQIAELLTGPHHLIPLSMNRIVSPLVQSRGSLRDSYGEIHSLIKELRSHRFDLAVNITHTLYSAALTSLAQAKKTIGLTLDSHGQRLVKGNWANYYFNSILNRGHNRFNLVDIHRLTGGIAKSYPVKLNLPNTAIKSADELISQFRSKAKSLIGVVPGASTAEKRWPVESLAAAVRHAAGQSSIQVIILGAPNEAPLAEQLNAFLPDAANLCGKTDVPTLAALIGRLDLLVTNDTGPMHLAAVAGTRVIDVTLGSALAYESAPYGVGHLVVEPRIGCFPCLPKFRCGHFSCQKLIPPELVGRLIVQTLEGNVIEASLDGSESAAVSIYRTDFDEDGYFDLIPLQHRPITTKELLNNVLREIWKRTLDNRSVWSDEAIIQADKLAEKLALRYAPPQEPINYENLANEMKKLGRLAEEGLGAARQVARLATNPTAVETIKLLGNALSEIDKGIIQLAYSHPELKPLAAQFTCSKDNLDSGDLASLAGGTAEIYHKLYEWCVAVPKWMQKAAQPFSLNKGNAIAAA
jgi:ADP-heptose:LPS heptosyltransferase